MNLWLMSAMASGKFTGRSRNPRHLWRGGCQRVDEIVLPKNFFLYVEKPAEATERPPDGQLNWLSGDG